MLPDTNKNLHQVLVLPQSIIVISYFTGLWSLEPLCKWNFCPLFFSSSLLLGIRKVFKNKSGKVCTIPLQLPYSTKPWNAIKALWYLIGCLFIQQLRNAGFAQMLDKSYTRIEQVLHKSSFTQVLHKTCKSVIEVLSKEGPCIPRHTLTFENCKAKMQ